MHSFFYYEMSQFYLRLITLIVIFITYNESYDWKKNLLLLLHLFLGSLPEKQLQWIFLSLLPPGLPLQDDTLLVSFHLMFVQSKTTWISSS